MKTLKFTLFVVFISTTTAVFSQIRQGTKSFSSSSIGFNGSNRRSQNNGSTSSIKTNSNAADLGLGAFDYFVTDRLQVGSGLGFNFSKTKSILEQPGTPNSEAFINNFNVNVTPSVNYYFFKKANDYFFLNVSSRIALGYSKIQNINNQPNDTTKNTQIEFSSGLGYLQPINENLAWVATTNFHYRKGNSNYVSLRAGLQNFFQFFNKKEEAEAPPQYLTKGRSLFAANFSFIHDFEESKSTTTTVQYTQLKFIKDRLAVGGYGNLFSAMAQKRSPSLSLSTGILARYYIPLTNRWFLYPELGYDISVFSKGKNINVFGFLNRNVGVEYFLTPNLAFNTNANLSFNVNKNNNGNSTLIGEEVISKGFSTFINIGFSYYTDKIFKK